VQTKLVWKTCCGKPVADDTPSCHGPAWIPVPCGGRRNASITKRLIEHGSRVHTAAAINVQRALSPRSLLSAAISLARVREVKLVVVAFNVATGLLAATLALAVGCAHPNHPSGPPTVAGESAANPEPKDSSPAGDIPDSQAFVAFAAPDASYTVEVPEGWARTDSPGGVTFTDKFNTVVIESQTGTSAPTPASARLTELAANAAVTPGVSYGDVSTVIRRAGQAIVLTYHHDSAPSPVTGKVTAQSVERYEFFCNGHTVTLTLAGPVGADNVDPWRRITDSFVWSP
jgi:hypothetical protein